MLLLYTLVLCVNSALAIDNFATKTHYEASLRIDSAEKFFPVFPIPPSCSPTKHVSVLYRHGSRYPSSSDVVRANETLSKLKPVGDKGEKALARLKQILNKFAEKEEKILAPRGFEEFEKIGRKLKDTHAALLNEYREGDFKFYVSEKERCIQSFESFVKGVWPNEAFKPTATIDNFLLRFYTMCNKYEREVDKNKSADVEVSLFMHEHNSFLNQEMLKQYKVYFASHNFTNKEMKSLFGLAGTELAVFDSRYFEDVFMNVPVVRILEYAADLKKYWKNAGGYEINYKQSCPLLKHIFNTFDNVVANSSNLKGSFYFGHAETNLPIFTLLGLFPEHLTSSNFPSMQHRSFKSTRITPFAGNIRFELLDCDGVMHIALYMKDWQLAWPSCGAAVCRYVEVRRHYEDLLQHCHFQQICLNNVRNEL